MKRNAMFRIALWGTILFVLLALFFFLLYTPGAGRGLRDETPAETMVAVPLPRVPTEDMDSGNAITTGDLNVRKSPSMGAEVIGFAEEGTVLNILRTETVGSVQWGYIGAPTFGWVHMDYVQMLEPVEDGNTDIQVTSPTEAQQYNAVVTADGLNVRTMPSSMSPTAGTVKKGDQLLITKQETVEDINWGYTPAPVNGWVMMEYIELLEETQAEIATMETTVSPEEEITGYGVALDAASIRDMEIEWAAGSIVIKPMDITEIRISEEGVNQDSDPMVWKVKDGKLAIQYSKNTDHDFGLGLLRGEHTKNLTIHVPVDWTCHSLEIDAASASLEVNDLTIREMEFDGASGTCVFSNCTVEALDVDTASGDVRFQGNLGKMDCDAASANIILELINVPGNLDLDTASGDLDVTLPEDAGFTVKLDTMSGDFESDFDTTLRNGSHVAGNGRCRIDVDAMSGSVTIRKNQ